MDNWEASLHWSFNNEHILLPSLRLDSLWSFLWCALLTISICLTERLVTFASEKHWGPSFVRRSRLKTAFWRSNLYGIVTLLRLSYMLIVMSFHIGLLLVTVTTLAIAQFFIELYNSPKIHIDRDSYSGVKQPLLHDENPYALKSVITRPRSRSKPDDIFIHPSQSNLARADAVALKMGLSSSTNLVHGMEHPDEEAAWESGKGRDMARALLGSSRKDSQRHPFHIGEDEQDSESSEL